MRHRLFITIAALAVAIAMGGALAYAETAKVEIKFDFKAGGQAKPAGVYTVETTPNGPISLKGPSGEGLFMPVMTRLGRHDLDADPELVFDSINGEFYLSEVWFPGQDGYLLLGTKEQHDHRVLGGSKPRK